MLHLARSRKALAGVKDLKDSPDSGATRVAVLPCADFTPGSPRTQAFLGAPAIAHGQRGVGTLEPTPHRALFVGRALKLLVNHGTELKSHGALPDDVTQDVGLTTDATEVWRKTGQFSRVTTFPTIERANSRVRSSPEQAVGGLLLRSTACCAGSDAAFAGTGPRSPGAPRRAARRRRNPRPRDTNGRRQSPVGSPENPW